MSVIRGGALSAASRWIIHPKERMENRELLFEKHYPALDFLRAIAITMVMAQHFAERAFILPAGLFKDLVLHGWYGVDLFFALSGFLIGGQIMERLFGGRFSFKEFYVKRVFRIFPPYYVSLAVLLVIYFSGAGYFVKLAVSPEMSPDVILQYAAIHIAYLQNYIYPLQGTYVFQGGIYWSLAVEEQFYLLSPVILYLLYKFRKEFLPAGLVVIIAAALAVRSTVWSSVFDPSRDNWQNAFMRPFHTRFDALVLGILAAYIFLKYKDKFYESVWLKFFLAVTSAGSLFYCATYAGPESSWFYSSVQFTLRGLGFSGLVLLFTVMPSGVYLEGFFSYIAKISYTMYLYHLMLVTTTMYVLVKVFGWQYDFTSGSHFIFAFSGYFILVVFASGLTYRFVDKPCMAYRKKIIERMRG